MELAAEAAERRTLLRAVQLAEKQLRPSSPKLEMVLGFAIFGGLAFGGGLVFLMHLLDRTIGTTEEAAARFDLPVHGAVEEIVTGRQRQLGRLKRWVVTPVVGVVLLAAISLSGLGVVLWLQHPDQYKTWKTDPVRYVRDHLTASR